MPIFETLVALTYEFVLKPKCDYCGNKHGRRIWRADGISHLTFMSKKCAMKWLRENEK